MAITYVGAGAVAATAVANTLDVTMPTVQAGDTLFIAALGSGSTGLFSVNGSFNEGVKTVHSTFGAVHLFWKQATLADSEAVYTLTKAASASEMHAIAFAFRGANAGTPLDSSGFVSRLSGAVNDNVFANAVDPILTTTTFCYLAFYYDNATTFTTPPASPASLTVQFDQESATGVGATFALCTVDRVSGAGFSPATWASNSTTDAHWASICFFLDPSVYVPGSFSGTIVTFLRRRRRAI